jgi:iron complex transport system substrate-binding protein
VKIWSLLPSATEILFALGLEDYVTGVTHECDYPPQAAYKPRVTVAYVDSSRRSAEIDAQVTERFQRGQQLYGIDEAKLREDPPDVIITQDICPVCAVSPSDFAGHMEGCRARVVTLNPNLLEDVLDNVRQVGDVTGRAQEAETLVRSLEQRIEAVRQTLAGAPRKRVLCLEWLDPPMPGGHWVPQMVQAAGGIDGPIEPGRPSRKVPWEEMRALEPEVIVLMPCGFTPERAARESAVLWDLPGWSQLSAVRKGEVYAVDGNSHFSRPGPRLVEGLEVLARILHPDRCLPTTPTGSILKLVSPPAGGSTIGNSSPRFEPFA